MLDTRTFDSSLPSERIEGMSYICQFDNGSSVEFIDDKYSPRAVRATREDSSFKIRHNERLTHAEVRWLVMGALGYQPEGAAKQLFVSVDTIRTQVKSVHSKLDTHNMAADMGWAFRTGLFRIETPLPPGESLTPCEHLTLEMSAEGMNTLEIAHARGLSENTVRRQTGATRQKYVVPTIAEAVAVGYLNQTLSLPYSVHMLQRQLDRQNPPVAM